MKKNKTTVAKAPFATFMHTLQCDLGPSAAKHNSITHAAAAARNLDAAIPIRSAETELLNAIQLHTMATQIAARNRIDAHAQKRRYSSTFSKKF